MGGQAVLATTIGLSAVMLAFLFGLYVLAPFIAWVALVV